MTPRQEARQRGDKKYQGADCLHGHGGIRLVSNNNCVMCQAEDARKRLLARIEARDSSRAAGSLYYAGTPCKRGHDGTRYVSSMNCVECQRIAARRARA